MDVAIKGYTDNQGWKNSTAAQSVQKNMDLSLQRANSVSNYLKQCGVSPTQITSVEGLGEADPVADNSTAAGRRAEPSCGSLFVCQMKNDSGSPSSGRQLIRQMKKIQKLIQWDCTLVLREYNLFCYSLPLCPRTCHPAHVHPLCTTSRPGRKNQVETPLGSFG